MLLLLLLVFAAAIRLVRLDIPDEVVFDETYYAKDACIYLEGREPEECGLTSPNEQSYVHPPLGKWIIAAGIKAFGYNSFGWRISAVVFGVGLVLLAYLITDRLFRSRWAALVAGLLVATDFLLFVQSRIAMLDIFLAFFVALGFLFVAIDREAAREVAKHLDGGAPGPPPVRGPGPRMAAGVAFGLALAVKWSAVYAMAAAALFVLAWSVGILRKRRLAEAAEHGAHRPGPARELVLTAVAFGVVPLVVYLASYSDWFARELSADCPYTVPAESDDRVFRAGFYGLVEGECVDGVTGVLLNFADLHQRVADYHLHLTATHPYQSKAWTWPFVLRPVAYYYEGESGRSNEILGTANIVVWGAALPALVWLAIRSRRPWRPERLVLAAYAAQYVPWLLVSRPLFFFYMTPAVPFLLIGLAAALDALRRRGPLPRRIVTGFLIVGVGVMLVIFYPVLTAIEIDYDLWRRLMWVPQFKCGGLSCGWI